MTRGAAALLLAVSIAAPSVLAAPPVALRISNESAPAGGWAQIRIYAQQPTAIAAGRLVLKLDPTAFGPDVRVGLFGANADSVGVATIDWPNIDIQFASGTAGIGQLAGLPVIVVSVPVSPTAFGRLPVAATSPDSTVTVEPGSVTVGGSLSIRDIPANMGVLAAGATVPVSGTGFTEASQLVIEGVALASTHYISPTEIDLVIGGDAELAGKLARVTDGSHKFEYYCFQSGAPSSQGSTYGAQFSSTQPLFPLFASPSVTGYSSYAGGAVAIQNPSATAASIAYTWAHCCSWANSFGASYVIPPGGWVLADGISDSNFSLNADRPVRVVAMSLCGGPGGLPACLTSTTPVDTAAVPSAPAMSLTPASLAVAWQTGAPAPADRTVLVARSVSVTATAASGASWLSVKTAPTYLSGATLTVSFNPSGLAPGVYQGTIQVRGAAASEAALPVTLTVTAAAVPILSASPATIAFTAPSTTAAPYQQTVTLAASAAPTPFSITLDEGTWLKVSPMSGTTPATLTLTWDPAVTSQIYYQQRTTGASMTISSPGNVVVIPATFTFTGVQTFQTFLGASGTGPDGLVFSALTGSAAQRQTINVDPQGVITATVDQPWMTAEADSNQTVVVTVNPAGLTPAVYTGAVTISEPGQAPIAVPVKFAVWSKPPKLTISKPSFTFVQTVGAPLVDYQSALLDSAGIPVPVTIFTSGAWLNVVDRYSAPTPTTLSIGIVNPPLKPGQYDGSFTIQSPGDSLYVPVTLLVEPGRATPPALASVVNVASGIAGAVAPGEIVSLRGYAVGAAAPSGLKLDPTGKLAAELNGLRVTFDGVPAPIVYTSTNQTNLIVPYEVTGRTSTAMRVTYTAPSGLVQAVAWVLPVTAAAPAIFTVGSTGVGQGVILNQDNSVNSAANPAAPGSTIAIIATGEGQTSPAGITGVTSPPFLVKPLLPVTASIGGVAAEVWAARSAPGYFEGVLQVDIVVPAGLPPGPQPITISVDGVSSQAGVTVAVQ
ncbi:MAG: hypothetical protein JSU00_14265 [Acidobacteria bacterium]|nr:hypothetical protein [Acidobacteriota bacterium]